MVRSEGEQGWKTFQACVPFNNGNTSYTQTRALPSIDGNPRRAGILGSLDDIPPHIKELRVPRTQLAAEKAFLQENHHRTYEIIYQAFPELKGIPHVKEFGTIKVLHQEDLPIPASSYREVEVPDHMLPFPLDEDT